jgi:DNA repair exonuclease SbcCD nuclease subunit
MKIGIVGDLHFKEKLGYADYVADRRIPEKEAVLEQIKALFEGYDLVVLMGDNLNSRNNHSEVIKDFVKFIHSIKAPIAILAGNHEKQGNGQSAIDFLEHIEKPWTIAIREPQTVSVKGKKIVLLPFLSRTELKCADNVSAAKAIQGMLPKGDILLAHQAFTGIMVNGALSDDVSEPILDKSGLEARYEKVVIGHIHAPKHEGKFLVAGSVFCNEVNEEQKNVWTLDVNEGTGEIKVIPHVLKQRAIRKIKDPTEHDLQNLTPSDWIIKAEVTKRGTDVEALKQRLKPFAGNIVVEHYPNERLTITNDSNVLDYSIENMLGLYAKAKNINPELLLNGYDLVKR